MQLSLRLCLYLCLRLCVYLSCLAGDCEVQGHGEKEDDGGEKGNDAEEE